MKNNFEKLVEEYKTCKRLEEELKKEQDGIKQQIIELMNGQEELVQGANKVTYKTVVTNRFDSKAFKKDHAEAYEMYLKQSVSKRFNVA